MPSIRMSSESTNTGDSGLEMISAGSVLIIIICDNVIFYIWVIRFLGVIFDHWHIYYDLEKDGQRIKRLKFYQDK